MNPILCTKYNTTCAWEAAETLITASEIAPVLGWSCTVTAALVMHAAVVSIVQQRTRNYIFINLRPAVALLASLWWH